MLIIILGLLAATSIIILLWNKDAASLLLAGVYVSCIIMFIGLILFLAKSGGLSLTQEIFLFLSRRIQLRL